LYVLLTSKPPFQARSLPELLRKHKSSPPIPIRSSRQDVSDELENIITDLLNIRPEDRPRNALLVAKRLQSLLQTAMGTATEIKVLPTSPETPKWHSESQVAQIQPQKNARHYDSTKHIRIAKSEIEYDAAPTSTATNVNTPAPPKADTNAADDNLANLSRSATRFTAVTKKDFDLYEEEEKKRPVFSLPTILTSTMLMIVGLTVYYLLQPIPPERLFKRITAAIQKGEMAEGYSLPMLRSAQSDIERFLSDYPDHPAAEQVRDYQEELDLLEHERRLERRMGSRLLSPVERAYVDALNSSPNDTEQTIVKLRAFIAVFQPVYLSSDTMLKPHLTSSPMEICVELASRRLKKLEQEFAEMVEEQEQFLRRRLEEADRLDLSHPDRAMEIRRGIIELYESRRWASGLVEEAKSHLEK
jgi:hypothetical protein